MFRAFITPTPTYLFQQQVTVGGQTRDQVFGQVQERAQHLQRQVVPRRALQHERDHQETAILNHVLLHGLRTLHQLADKTQQLGTAKQKDKVS